MVTQVEIKRMTPITVCIADDHNMVRKGLAFLIDGFSDLQLVGEAANGEEAVQCCQRLQPDVILMDMMMPVMDGIDATLYIRQHWPQTQIVALTSYQESSLLQNALDAGALCYLLKDAGVDELIKAIRKASRGESYISAQAAQMLTKHQPPSKADLTPREYEVLMCMAKGCTNPQIAEQLNISRYTVSAHVRNILGKIGVATRTQAVAQALKEGII
jgi:DNA-binding NarL/FixJ family response regulator